MEEGFTHIPKIVKQGDLNSTDNPYVTALKKEIKDQYMMGESILVAPMFTGQKIRTVILPKGKWYDFYTGELVGDGSVITASHGLDKIPLYVKDGAIIPMMKQIRNTSEWGNDTTLEVRVYGHKPSEFVLYDDDGNSYDYEEGSYTQKVLETTLENGHLKGNISKLKDGESWSYGNINWTFMTK